MTRNYKHFNSATVIEAAEGWNDLLDNDGKMFLTLAGAMSTAEMGISIAELIRQDKVHAITCTGANLEEDFFNLVAHDSYFRVPNWRTLSLQDEMDLLSKGYNRVTDTCIPEDKAMRRIETELLDVYSDLCSKGESVFPYELFYRMIEEGVCANHYEIDTKDSWLIAAQEKNLPIFTPGWEDSTCGNMIVAAKIDGRIPYMPVKSGLDAMEMLVEWYEKESTCEGGVGFFQIGGGIAGDFPICCVPLIRQDLERDVKLWSYFCQISDAPTSYGGYSGAPPNEKITWGKLHCDTPAFIIESDATIVFPLVSAYVLDH